MDFKIGQNLPLNIAQFLNMALNENYQFCREIFEFRIFYLDTSFCKELILPKIINTGYIYNFHFAVISMCETTVQCALQFYKICLRLFASPAPGAIFTKQSYANLTKTCNF